MEDCFPLLEVLSPCTHSAGIYVVHASTGHFQSGEWLCVNAVYVFGL